MKSSLSNILANLGDDQQESKRKKIELVMENEVRSWQDLPESILSKIFEKLGAFDIVYRAQSVCSAWRNLSKQPHLFRFIDWSIPPWGSETRDIDITKIGKHVIDRSCGQLVGLSMVIYETDDVLCYALDSPNCLKFLQLEGISTVWLMSAITKVPHLEKLVVSLTRSSYQSSRRKLITELGRSCPQLKYFSWYSGGVGCICIHDDVQCEDEQVLAIAEHMPQLRELHLHGNVVTNKGMQAILGGCLHMENLDLENCYYSTDLTEESLGSSRERIKSLKLPRHRHYCNCHLIRNIAHLI